MVIGQERKSRDIYRAIGIIKGAINIRLFFTLVIGLFAAQLIANQVIGNQACVYAQAPQTDKVYNDLFANARPQIDPNINSPTSETRSQDPTTQGPQCKPEDKECLAEQKQLPASGRERTIVSRVPDSQILNNGTFLEKMNQSMTAQATMKSVAIRMIEPAIEASRASMDLQGTADTTNMYGAQEAFVADASINPETREVILESARGCEVRERGTGASWTEAFMKCHGANGQAGYSGKDHPDSAAALNADGAVDGAPEGEENAVLLSQRIFNPLLKQFEELQESNSSVEPGVMTPAEAIMIVTKLRERFLMYLGDYKIVVGQDDASGSAPTSGFTLVPDMLVPRPPDYEPYEPRKFLVGLSHSTLVTLSNVMRKRCEWDNRSELGSDQQLDDNYNPFDPKQTDFWSQCERDSNGKCKAQQDEKKFLTQDDIERLSTYGWSFKRTTQDMLNSLVVSDIALRKNEKVDCSLIQPFLITNSNNNAGGNNYPWDFNGKIQNAIQQVAGAYYFSNSTFQDANNIRYQRFVELSRLIARGKQLDNIFQLELDLARLATLKRPDSDLVIITRELLTQAALGAPDREAAIVAISQRLAALEQDLKDTSSRETGKDAGIFTSGMGHAKTGNRGAGIDVYGGK